MYIVWLIVLNKLEEGERIEVKMVKWGRFDLGRILITWFWFILFYFFVFLGPHLQYMEVPRLGVESELQLPAYATATATPWYATAHGNTRSLTHWVRPGNEPGSPQRHHQVLNRWATAGTPQLFLKRTEDITEFTHKAPTLVAPTFLTGATWTCLRCWHLSAYIQRHYYPPNRKMHNMFPFLNYYLLIKSVHVEISIVSIDDTQPLAG